MIKFENIEIKFGDFVAIKDLNLEINKGEFFTLLGPSGCGKTTTLRSLVGFIEPTQGTISLDGKILNNIPVEKRPVSMVFQSYALFPTLTVYENIAFGLKVKKVSKKEIEQQVKEIAKSVDLSDEQLAKKVSELSGGQQQRVAIARALILKPDILALDEPLSNLDAKLRKQLRIELKNLQKEFGITTIYVTHDQEEALTLSDRIAVFNKGFLEQVGTPEEVYNQSKSEFVCNFIGEVNNITDIVNLEQNRDKVGKGEKHFVRIEKTEVVSNETKQSKDILFKAQITEKEFYGLYTKYTAEYNGVTVKLLEKDYSNSLSVGDAVNVLIRPENILSY